MKKLIYIFLFAVLLAAIYFAYTIGLFELLSNFHRKTYQIGEILERYGRFQILFILLYASMFFHVRKSKFVFIASILFFSYLAVYSIINFSSKMIAIYILIAIGNIVFSYFSFWALKKCSKALTK